MSFDLHVVSRSAALGTDLMKLADAFGCEAYELSKGWSVTLSGLEDERVIELYASIIKLAKKRRAKVIDPQSGRAIDLKAPGRVPPQWGSSPTARGRPVVIIDGKSFAAKEKQLLALLAEHGFEPAKGGMVTRAAEHHVQKLKLVRASGKLTIHIYRTFDFRMLAVPEQVDVSMNLGWLPASPASAMNEAFQTLAEKLSTEVLPMLDATKTIEALVAAFERGELDVHGAFGIDFRIMSDCYAALDRRRDGWKRFKAWMAPSLESSDPRTRDYATQTLKDAEKVFLFLLEDEDEDEDDA